MLGGPAEVHRDDILAVEGGGLDFSAVQGESLGFGVDFT